MMTWNSFYFQTPSSVLSESVGFLHDFVMMFLYSVLMIVVSMFLMIFFSKKFNSLFFESDQLEAVWTVVPFVILVVIAIPSMKSLYMLDSCVFCGLSVLITGHQWYWTYLNNIVSTLEFNSYMLLDEEGALLRLIDTDNRLVVPSSIPIRYLVTSSDVIHSWTIPSLGMKMDAVPGRINQFCTATKKSGIYFGQCSEICGSNHSFMPIVMESLNIKSI